MDTARLAAVASPRRREILRLLWNQEMTAGAIRDAMPDVTFGAVSLQLKVLLDAGLVECEADRQFRVYRVKREALGPVAPMLEQMWNDALWRLKFEPSSQRLVAGRNPASRRRPRRRKKSDGV